MKKMRIKRIQITPEVLPQMFTQNNAWRVYQGVPAGSIYKGMTVDPHNQVINIFVEHPSFEAVDAYSIFPTLDLEFLKIV